MVGVGVEECAAQPGRRIHGEHTAQPDTPWFSWKPVRHRRKGAWHSLDAPLLLTFLGTNPPGFVFKSGLR